MSKDSKIDFWCIGVQKCGTTWLYSHLRSIPEFGIPPVKELHYFDKHLPSIGVNDLSVTHLKDRIKVENSFLWKGIKTVGRSLKQLRIKDAYFFYKWYFLTYSDQWYVSLFKSMGAIKGEITPRYSILSSDDIQQMYQLSSNAKILIMLRNPIDRAWSHYRYKQGFDLEKNESGQKDIDLKDIIDFIECDGQVNRSNYLQTINNYLRVFPKEQIMIGFYDAIVKEPNRLLNDIAGFFGLQREVYIDTNQISQVVYKSREIKRPLEITDYLKQKYHDQLKKLSETYGGYFKKWYSDTYNLGLCYTEDELTPTLCLGSKLMSR